MFGSSKKSVVNTSAGPSGNVETLIGKTTSLNGVLNSDGSVRVEGMFEGQITAKGDIFIGPDSRIKAEINGRNVTISGTVTGNVSVNEKLELLAGATLNGDIKVKKLVIEEGAVFKGISETKNEIAKPMASVTPAK
ncbi:MAG: polymer-forming cytoskeletal protein [Acidaminococcales bacterium]|nr:polymer-forming cytoskeletal protein [Acidaminococcales bacterium]